MEIAYNINEIDQVAQQLIKNFSNKTILFIGEMGTGKTTLIKALVKTLGSNDDVSSPTFSIVNEYQSPDAFIYHFDMYRIEDETEALNFGFEDYFVSNNNWIFIEWPQNVASLLPENVDLVSIYLTNNHSRTLKLTQNINLTEHIAMKAQNLT